MANSDIQQFRKNLLGEGVPALAVDCLKQDDKGVGGVGRAVPNGRPYRRDAVRAAIKELNKIDIDPCLYARIITWATGREVKTSNDGLVYGGSKPGVYPAPFGTPESILSEINKIRKLKDSPPTKKDISPDISGYKNTLMVVQDDIRIAWDNWLKWRDVFEHTGPVTDNPILSQSEIFRKFLSEYSVNRTIRRGIHDELRIKLRSKELRLGRPSTLNHSDPPLLNKTDPPEFPQTPTV